MSSAAKKTFAQLGAEQIASEPTPALGYNPDDYVEETGNNFRPVDFFYVFIGVKKDGTPINANQRQLKPGTVVIGKYLGSFTTETKKGPQTTHRIETADGQLVGMPGVRALNDFLLGSPDKGKPGKPEGSEVVITYVKKGVAKSGNDFHEFLTLLKKTSIQSS